VDHSIAGCQSDFTGAFRLRAGLGFGLSRSAGSLLRISNPKLAASASPQADPSSSSGSSGGGDFALALPMSRLPVCSYNIIATRSRAAERLSNLITEDGPEFVRAVEQDYAANQISTTSGWSICPFQARRPSHAAPADWAIELVPLSRVSPR
jgi:hypothetical protein